MKRTRPGLNSLGKRIRPGFNSLGKRTRPGFNSLGKLTRCLLGLDSLEVLDHGLDFHEVLTWVRFP
jgi:hypothetical protein